VGRFGGYELSTAPERLDLDLIHRWLSTDAYWAIGRPRETVVRSLEGSIGYGAFRISDGGQVAFARAVTDRATFAWICDVYVDRPERGRGLGGWLVGAVRDHLHGLGVTRLVLATHDAHDVYRRLGFTPMAHPDYWLELDTRSLPDR
jgi:GNAT superfamily N-acetyltransferase